MAYVDSVLMFCDYSIGISNVGLANQTFLINREFGYVRVRPSVRLNFSERQSVMVSKQTYDNMSTWKELLVVCPACSLKIPSIWK